ncbi:carbohydrate kinase family protein [Sulfobacillus thermosulfidooxidans]|uniref:carbohydrate kinase family protein n=1 Tax=Sulfobacillus thermosulfidooxidans TaxID=28034 RepID=UPI000B005FB7|nr:PfkB family carbohydrate kinase [Sulfobacillus thermosulfidooxidans]
MDKNMQFVLIGSIIVDIQLLVSHIPFSGEDVMARDTMYYPGGGFNVLSAVTRQGVPALYAGRIGSGPMGKRIRDALRQEGITCLPVYEDGRGDTGFVITMVEPSGERTFVTSPGIESHIRPEDLAALNLNRQDVVYVSGYDLLYPVSGATIAEYLRMMHEDIRLVFDPGPLIGDIAREHLEFMRRRAWIITANRAEICQWMNQREMTRATALLAAGRPPHSMVVARDGENGAWFINNQELVYVPPRPAQVIDLTGAGDTHTGVLVAFLMWGWPVNKAMWAANIAASLSVEQRGPATSPRRQDIERLMSN